MNLAEGIQVVLYSVLHTLEWPQHCISREYKIKNITVMYKWL